MNATGHDAGLPKHRELSQAHADTLVGRVHELQLLDSLLDRAAGGAGGAVLIEGTAGLGKSRLVAEVAARGRARGLRVLDARAIEPERGFPFAVALQLFEAALAAPDAAALFEGAAGLARPLFSGEYTDATIGSPFPLQHGLFWLTVSLTRRAPLLVCVDDAQWCDDGSLGFVRYLARRIEELPIVLVIAARPSGSGPSPDPLAGMRESWTYQRIRLAPLTADEVAVIVRDRLPSADGPFCTTCAALARGNPFYVREVLRSVEAEGLAPTGASSQRLQKVGFESISRAALFRLVRLGPDPILLARALSVLGDGTPLRRAAALAGLDRARATAAADALDVEGLIVSGPALTFTHPLIATLVHDEIPAMQAAVAHGQAARLLATESAAPEAVAAHLLLTSADGDQWVSDTLRLAAQRARAQGIPGSAAQLLARALDEPPSPAQRADVLIELGSAESAAGLPTGVDHLREALALRTDPLEREDARRQLARALAAQGEQREAAGILELALDEAGSLAHAAPLLTDYLVNAVFEPGLRQRAFSRIAALDRDAPFGTTAAEREVLATLAMRSGQDGAPATETIELADRAWGNGKLLEEQGADAPGWLMTVWSLELAGDHRRAEAVALATLETARTAGSLEAFATASVFCAWARSAMGRVVDAQADLEQAVAAGQLGWRRYLVAALSRQAVLHIWRGELDAAAQALTQAEVHDRRGGMEVPWRLHASGQLAMARHDNAGALRLHCAAGAWLTEHLGVDYTVLTWRTDAARAAVALGDLDAAVDLLEHDAVLAQRSAAPGHLGRVVRVRGLIAGGDQGVALLHQASDHFARAGEALERAETLTDLGALLRRQGDRTEARPYLAEALDVAVRAGATRLAERARDELAASGARRQIDHVSGPAALTPSERRVAQLAADGLTNTRVAQALFVTPKTVEYHLRHVYQKLGITGRSEIATALAHTAQQP